MQLFGHHNAFFAQECCLLLGRMLAILDADAPLTVNHAVPGDAGIFFFITFVLERAECITDGTGGVGTAQHLGDPSITGYFAARNAADDSINLLVKVPLRHSVILAGLTVTRIQSGPGEACWGWLQAEPGAGVEPEGGCSSSSASSALSSKAVSRSCRLVSSGDKVPSSLRALICASSSCFSNSIIRSAFR